MSWLNLLQTTYVNAYGSPDASREENQLLPVSHTTQLANIEITLDLDGSFVDARVLLDEERTTLIPCTEDSAARVGPGAKLRPHALHDKLQYVAGDYMSFGGAKGRESHEQYIKQLESWLQFSDYNPYLNAVFDYVRKGQLVEDLVNANILHVDDSGDLIEKWDDELGREKPDIFSSSVAVQSDAFVRFRIRDRDGRSRMNFWENEEIINSFIDFFASTQGKPALDYVTGEIMACANVHPKKIRHSGDGAKLLSSNDKTGFTFRGRFESAEEAVQIGYRPSQEAHNALIWLIRKQGTKVGDRVFLTFGTTDPVLPDPTGSSAEVEELADSVFDELFGEAGSNSGSEFSSEQFFASRFNLALNGYKQNVEEHCQIAVMALDAATPGRMAMTFFREYLPNEQDDFFESLGAWHERLAWQNFSYSRKLEKTIRFFGAPSLRDIALAAFGVQRGDFLDLEPKVVAATMQRLFPNVLNQHLRIPHDIVIGAYRNACRPQAFSEFNWAKVRGVACSLIKAERYQLYKENWTMDVNRDSNDLYYNLGRLLAVLDTIEADAMYDADSKRPTSSQRLFSKFADHPNNTLGIIAKQLVPYRMRLGARGAKLYAMEQEIAAKIDPEALVSVRNMDGRFLLGFDSQKYAIIQDRINAKNEANNNEDAAQAKNYGGEE